MLISPLEYDTDKASVGDEGKYPETTLLSGTARMLVGPSASLLRTATEHAILTLTPCNTDLYLR